MTTRVPGDLRRVMRRFGGAVFLTDSQGVILEWSSGARELLGYEDRQVLGRPCHVLFEGRDAFGNVYCVEGCPILQSCRRGQRPRPHELTMRRADGQYSRYHCVVTPVDSTRPAHPLLLYQVFESWPAPTPAPAAPANAPGCGALPLAPPRPQPLASVDEAPPRLGLLTLREREVLVLLAQGLSSGAIAARLGITPATLRNHVNAVLRKLGVHSKLEAVVFAYRRGLVERG